MWWPMVQWHSHKWAAATDVSRQRALPGENRSSSSASATFVEVDGLPLQDMQERLRRLQNLHVGALRLLNRSVVLVSRLGFPHEAFVQALQAVRQDRELLLDLRLVLFLCEYLPVQLLALRA
eukprot:CAMPEP_0176081268 /NCGR_PEP_ID=MMETSP0120_2-20121206/40652_1 /TAXON_ID=160619 /ORGANISM="Kryptoperidinium foliaceum, Strain CCMP 1326" /LENGTH=121 /DNA_ID=CAMNT_0017415037 /DNA_START=123 /DNA_END=488 /DNA_ORIENTATION=+